MTSKKKIQEGLEKVKVDQKPLGLNFRQEHLWTA
jgi:hypothetical protein